MEARRYEASTDRFLSKPWYVFYSVPICTTHARNRLFPDELRPPDKEERRERQNHGWQNHKAGKHLGVNDSATHDSAYGVLLFLATERRVGCGFAAMGNL